MADVKGKDNYEIMPQIDGVDIVPSGGTINQVLTKDSGTSYDYSWQDATGGGTPGGDNRDIQFNNSGSFGGSSNFEYNSTTQRVSIQGIAETTALSINETASSPELNGGATLYIEVNTPGAGVEGMRTYFDRQSPGINGWITYFYDGNTPNLRIIDEDDDPPYVAFQTIGSGSFDSPQFDNRFLSRGGVANVTTGFSWEVNGSEIMTADSDHLLIPVRTTANRPSSPTNGMVGYNSTTNKFEGYENGSWKEFNTMRPTFPIWAEENSGVSVGANNYEYSFGNGAVNNTANPPGIPVGVACTLIAITISARNAQSGTSSFSVSVVNNGSVVATGGVASASGTNTEVKNTTQVTPDTVNFAAGDTVQFLTASASGSLDDVRVCAWFERTS